MGWRDFWLMTMGGGVTMIVAIALRVWWWNRKEWPCRHDRIRTIYGDEINAYAGLRSMCRDCGAAFKDHAYTRPTPAKEPDDAR